MLVSTSGSYTFEVLQSPVNTKFHVPFNPPKEVKRGHGISTASFALNKAQAHICITICIICLGTF